MSEPKLTTKQRAFVEEYLANGFNATEAARRVGYAHPNKRGPENEVKRGIREAIEARLSEMVMSANEVLARLSAMARTDMSDFMQIYPGGTPAFDFEKAAEAKRLGLIKKFKVTAKSIEMELYDAQAALVHLGKYHTLFTDRVQHTWQDEIIDLLRHGKVSPDDVRNELGDDLAEELFKSAGVPVTPGGEGAAPQSQSD